MEKDYKYEPTEKEDHDLEEPDINLEDPPKKFDEPYPFKGQDLVPPIGTVPSQMLIMNAVAQSILRKLIEIGSTYDGELNYYGARHGKGKMTYFDGSTYEGDWSYGLKSGYGVLSLKDGTVVYKGHFLNDLKEGEGEMTLPNGDVIKTTWKANKKCGTGTKTTKDGVKNECMYDQDVEIKFAEQNPDCYNSFPLNLFLVLLAITFFLVAIHKQRIEYWIVGALFYLGQLIEAGFSHTNSFLSNIQQIDRVQNEMKDLKGKPPIVDFTIQNYHYEHHHSGSGKHKKRRQTRVNTHYAREPFRYFDWLDQSTDACALDYIKRTRVVRMNFGVIVEYTPTSSQSYVCQEHYFKTQNIRDTHFDYSVVNTISGLEPFVLMQNSNSWLPWYAQKCIFWLFTLVGLGWFFRIIFVCNSQRVTYDFNKLIAR